MLKSEESYFSSARAVYETVAANVSYALTTHFTIIHLLVLKFKTGKAHLHIPMNT